MIKKFFFLNTHSIGYFSFQKNNKGEMNYKLNKIINTCFNDNYNNNTFYNNYKLNKMRNKLLKQIKMSSKTRNNNNCVLRQ